MDGGESFRGNFYDVATISVSLPRLDPDLPAACPVPLDVLMEYVATESNDGTPAEIKPTFLRTARIGQTQYWIWSFHDPRRGDGYAVVSKWPNGPSVSGCDDTFDMTPEQYLLAMHFQIEP